MKLDIVKLALRAYDDTMYIYQYYWTENPEVTSTIYSSESSKRRAYIHTKTHALIIHDRILINGHK